MSGSERIAGGSSAIRARIEHAIRKGYLTVQTISGVPNDEAVNEGIRTRKAYGGGATRTAFAVLCAMEAETREESPARDRLTLEHVMPQKLTPEWRRALGDSAEEVHGTHRDRLANLTLSGDATNAGLGTRTFSQKSEIYRNSPIGMTRRVAREADWGEEALERRAGKTG